MKRVAFAVFLILGVLTAGFGQDGPIDLILLLDTSSSMSGSYREVNDYMTGAFLKEFLRIGDTFHLIPFSDAPRLDVSRRVEGRGDVETIIGRMLLQYPLEPKADISAALSYAERYTSSLPVRPKKIILLTDGDTVSLDAAGLQNLVAETKTRLGRQGIGLEYVKVPLTVLPSSGRPPLVPASTGTAAAGSRPAQTAAPPPAQTVQPQSPAAEPFQPRQSPAQTGQSPGAGASQPALSDQGSPVRGTETGIPGSPAVPGSSPAAGTPPGRTGDSGSLPAGTPSLPDRPEPSAPAVGADGAGLTPPEQIVQTPGEPEPPRQADTVPPAQPASPSPGTAAPVRQYNQNDLSLPLIIGLALLGLAALGLIIFLVTRRLQGTPQRAMAQAAARPEPEEVPAEGRFVDHSAALASYAATQRPRTGPYAHRDKPQNVEYGGPLMLNLFVEDQSTLIGKRNIHAVKSGYTFTVGGGKSDFLIFLVPMPPHIGEVRCDGNRCTFIPRNAQYFPDTGSQQVPDCIGKTIRVISDKNYELHFRMERYEDPLKALNRLLHSVQVPG
ncbi:MAG: VWA domain-containing protein [Treponema sp.]|jgi:hypothetical protein|nr:VWA domain-containing protein [Treponema sp.]